MHEITYLAETAANDHEIEEINAEAFGPGRFARAAYKIREGGPHERALSFVATHGGRVIATVRLTRITVGGGCSLLLGPLAVRPSHKDLGIGRKLVNIAIDAAREAGWPSVILVGDEPYYGPLGFRQVPLGQIAMPRPVDYRRLLIHELQPGALDALRGEMRHADFAPDISQRIERIAASA
ncbi:N-acetyltransferase [Aquibium carbonis]|uniref:N-acetyltransferase n=1 Tax=Aquibium carbonis TaxID=2495581 RepID=A0A3R9YAL6_9HYPH|nr:N-acetyltransferase [Aquibium carbonis]RST87976.1 N-acetyltransferase [Aquibium carbonis]